MGALILSGVPFVVRVIVVEVTGAVEVGMSNYTRLGA
jgi:hypothetical protein